ncbi:hypothetical protein SLEP1_g13913 [Rubroshorea leprosula]|uniref:Uncharacterized protein n=1 Tax=Rubroshorea leprosula TaxID=152421 RepID=A0AAV5IHE4_9ROSI|nr:hypothetical protein SLEP1_g13913 [Rubroshorea leprosula]
MFYELNPIPSSHTDGKGEEVVLRKVKSTQPPKIPAPASVVHQQQKRTAAAQPCSSPPSHAVAQLSWEIPTTAHHSANCNSPFGFCCF